jgi:hypothetical protein
MANGCINCLSCAKIKEDFYCSDYQCFLKAKDIEQPYGYCYCAGYRFKQKGDVLEKPVNIEKQEIKMEIDVDEKSDYIKYLEKKDAMKEVEENTKQEEIVLSDNLSDEDKTMFLETEMLLSDKDGNIFLDALEGATEPTEALKELMQGKSKINGSVAPTKFWVVVGVNENHFADKYTSEEMAVNEAKRLAKILPGERLLVLELKGYAFVPEVELTYCSV